jgi:hypothetical protein
MIDISKIEFKTNSIFDLTRDLSLIEEVTGINFTNPDGFLFETEERYLKNFVDNAKVCDMLSFAEQTEDEDLKNFITKKYDSILASFFNE